MVVKMAGSEPLKNARVRLLSQDDRNSSRTVVTDSGGRFELRGISPGRYRLTVNRDGFVTQAYGQRKPDDPGAILNLRPNQELKDLLFRLVPSAVIAGRVINDDGDPMPWVHLEALREAYSGGKKTLFPETTVPTNDLGEYRLFGLPPGRYLVRAEYKPTERVTGRGDEFEGRQADELEYVPIYYPSSTEPARASSVAVKAGEEIPGLQILLRRVDLFTVRGRVFGMTPRLSNAVYTVVLSPRGDEAWLSFPQRDAIVDDTDRTFTIRGVLPGPYLLGATWIDEGRRYQAFQSIDVGNADVDGVTLTVAPGMSVSGRITWDGKPTSDKNRLVVYLRAINAFYRPRATVTPQWTFLLNDVYDLTYRVAVFGLCDDCYLKTARYAGITSEDEFTPARGSNAALELTISSKGARVRGSVVDEDNLPAIGVWVSLLPEAAHRSTHRLYKSATTDQYGHFELRGIAPGDYKLFSWEEAESGAWEDPEFLKPFEAKGEKISLQDSDQKTLSLTAIRTKDPESPKP
jgi:protocatechuate 3,4-dioxygenase beta subunit